MPPKKAKPISGKERQRRWRERKKADTESHEKYLQAERDRYAQRKLAGKRKAVADMTPREQRKQRKKWVKQQKDYRERQTAVAERQKAAANFMTPPSSPCPDAAPQPSISNNKVRGRKQVRRDRAKAYRKIEKLTVKLHHSQLATKRVQKRYERAVKKN